MKYSKRLCSCFATLSLFTASILLSACGDDPVHVRRKMDDDMMAYRLRYGLTSATSTLTVSVTTTVTVTH